MELGSISIKQVDEIISRRDMRGQAVPFDIAYRTFSSKKGLGGQLITRSGVTYKPSANPDVIKKEGRDQLLQPKITSRNPNHHDNWTRNLQLPDGGVRKVYIEFIISINDQKVRY